MKTIIFFIGLLPVSLAAGESSRLRNIPLSELRQNVKTYKSLQLYFELGHVNMELRSFKSNRCIAWLCCCTRIGRHMRDTTLRQKLIQEELDGRRGEYNGAHPGYEVRLPGK